MFRSARQSQRLSQQQLAALADSPPVSRTTISAIEGGRLPNVEALVSLSNVLHIDPVEVLERVALASPAPIDLSDLEHDELRRRAERFSRAGDHRNALSVYDAMQRRLSVNPPVDPCEARRLEATVEIDRATALRRCRALRPSEVSAKRAVELAKGRPTLQAEALIVLASLYSHQQTYELAEIAAKRAIALSTDGDTGLQGRAWNRLGEVLRRAGRFEEARRAFLEARKLAIWARDPRNRASSEGNVGLCLLALGRTSQARHRLRTAVELARKYDDPAVEARWLVELGRVALLEGSLDEADRHARAALRIAKPSDRVLTVFRAEWLRHRIARRRSPRSDDRHRFAYLRTLYVRVREHEAIDEVREFKRTVLRAAQGAASISPSGSTPATRPRATSASAGPPARCSTGARPA